MLVLRDARDEGLSALRVPPEEFEDSKLIIQRLAQFHAASYFLAENVGEWFIHSLAINFNSTCLLPVSCIYRTSTISKDIRTPSTKTRLSSICSLLTQCEHSGKSCRPGTSSNIRWRRWISSLTTSVRLARNAMSKINLETATISSTMAIFIPEIWWSKSMT